MHSRFYKKVHDVQAMESLGQRLKRLRKARGLNQSEAAAALPELDRSYISKIENDKNVPSWEILCGLADLYEVSIDYIRFGDSPHRPRESGIFIHDSSEVSLIKKWRNMNEDDKKIFLSLAEKFDKGDE